MQNHWTIVRGFTLVELVIVILLISIVGIGSANFVRTASDIYVDVTEREFLLRNASFAVERFTRELSNAVPNSVRVSGNATSHCVEFVPINWNGYYMRMPQVSETSPEIDVVKMADIDGNLFVPSSNDYAIIYPLNSAHVYNPNQNRRQAILSCNDDGDGDCSTDDDADAIIQLSVSQGFSFNSPNRRVYIADRTVSYCVRNQSLYRHESTINLNQTIFTSGGDLMATGIANTLSASPSSNPTNEDPFRAVGATLTRNAFTRANFLFARDDEQISIVKEVHVPNVP